jgi:hypothetical protein
VVTPALSWPEVFGVLSRPAVGAFPENLEIRTEAPRDDTLGPIAGETAMIWGWIRPLINGGVDVWLRLRPPKSTQEQKRRLRERMSAVPPEWRSTARLSKLIQADDPTTRQLLLEIGAEHSMGEKDIWRQPPKGRITRGTQR